MLSKFKKNLKNKFSNYNFENLDKFIKTVNKSLNLIKKEKHTLEDI